MSNVLDHTTQQQILALGRLGWTLSRIQETTGVRRETVSGYLKAAGIPDQEHLCARDDRHHAYTTEQSRRWRRDTVGRDALETMKPGAPWFEASWPASMVT
jgi:hypothetical protein